MSTVVNLQLTGAKEGLVTHLTYAVHGRQQTGSYWLFGATIKIITTTKDPKNIWLTIYNNSGAHVITLEELASTVANVLGAELEVKVDLMDKTAPKVVLIDNRRINSESGYDCSQEKSIHEYLQEMIYG